MPSAASRFLPTEPGSPLTWPRAGSSCFVRKTWAEIASSSSTTTKHRGFVRFSPDGRTVAARNQDKEVVLLSGTDLARVRSFPSRSEGTFSFAFSHKRTGLALGHVNHPIEIVRLDGKHEPMVLAGPGQTAYTVAFSPDGLRLASGADDRKLRIWDLSDGLQIAQLSGHYEYIYALGFSPDGERLVTASGDRTARIWEITPVAHRYRALNEREAIAGRLRSRVDSLLAAGTPRGAAREIRSAPDLEEREREIALQLVLARVLGEE